MKIGKTEEKLLKRMYKHPVHGISTYYQGRREADAAVKLEKRGWAKKEPQDGTYTYRTRMGYKKGYEPQGRVKLIVDPRLLPLDFIVE